MKKELDDRLVAAAPRLYRDRYADVSESCMPWGFSCGGGWFDILLDFSKKTEKIIRQFEAKYPNLSCSRCVCGKEEHYGYKRNPGKCLAVKKIGTKYLKTYWVYGTGFRRLYKRCMRFFTNTINSFLKLFFYKYQVCYCDKYDPTSPKAVQIKEKFGSLRIYMNYYFPEIEKLIDDAVKKADETCERCGQPGELRQGGWWRTLCDSCEEKRGK